MTPEIRTLGPDEKIVEPGFYNITLDRHHAQPCDGPSVTSGVLRKMELESPADVWAFHLLNPNRWEREQTDALRLGRAMAAYVEGGMDAVAQHFMVLPADKPRKPTDAQIAAYDAGKITDANRASVEFWRAVEKDPRDPLTEAEQKMIEDMGKALALDPGACAAMGGIPEVTMAVQDERTGLWLLSRPDTVSFDGMMTDYKKINTQGRPFNHRVIDNRITEHGYDMQMSLAADVFEALTGDRPEVVAIVGQWDKPPHHVVLREILDEDLRLASFRNRRAIDRFAECLASGHWPGPGDDVGYYRRPEWQRDMILQQMNMEGTAP